MYCSSLPAPELMSFVTSFSGLDASYNTAPAHVPFQKQFQYAWHSLMESLNNYLNGMCVRRFSGRFGEVRETAGALWDCPLQSTHVLLSMVLIHWNSNRSLLLGVCLCVCLSLRTHSRQLGTDLTFLVSMALHTECQSNFSRAITTQVQERFISAVPTTLFNKSTPPFNLAINEK